MASCSERPCASEWYRSLKLTRESLDGFTARLTGGATDIQSAMLPLDFAAAESNAKLWIKYIVGSAAVLGSVDRRALDVIHGLLGGIRMYDLSNLLEELAKRNDQDTVAHFIARRYSWDTPFGKLVVELVGRDWDAMRPLFEGVLAFLRRSEDKSREYVAILRCVPAGSQYERINSGKTPLDEIDRIHPLDEPYYPLLREVFFQARCSPNPNPVIRRYIAEKAPWFKQFMPEDVPGNTEDACATIDIEPSHDVWARICSFMDVETLIFVWPLVCRAWSRSYSRILTGDVKIHELFLRDLNHIDLHDIREIAPWNHFLNEANSAIYLGQCIISGALGREELGYLSSQEVKSYLQSAIRGEAPIPKAGKEGALCESFARLVEEGYKALSDWIPTLVRPPFLNDEDHERLIHYLVCGKKLAVKISCQWIIDNVSRIYSILGEDQGMVQKVIELSTYDYQEAMFIWIMIGQVCGITEETARLVFDKPGMFIEKLIRPVVVKPSGYYDFIADSGMLFEMAKTYYEHIAHRAPWHPYSTYQLSGLMASLILFFKDKPGKIEQIIASVTSQLPTLGGRILKHMRSWFGTQTMKILADNSKYTPEDIEFAREVLTRCGLLGEPAI